MYLDTPFILITRAVDKVSIPPDKALFFSQKLIFFLFLCENICCGYSLEAPR